MDFDVARPSRLLWGMPTDPRMSAKTNYRCSNALEKFLEPSEVTRLFPTNVTL